MRPEPNRAAHPSGRVKTAQGAAMPRSGCSPSGTGGAVVSAATETEISTDRPSGRHNPSTRLNRLTAGPIAVKSSRSAAPIWPHRISPRCSAAPKGSGGSPAPAAPHRGGPCRRGRQRPRAVLPRRPGLARRRLRTRASLWTACGHASYRVNAPAPIWGVRDIAPSVALRRRFHGSPTAWKKLKTVYFAELECGPLWPNGLSQVRRTVIGSW